LGVTVAATGRILVLPASSGILMAAPHLMPELVPLQAAGLLPILFALAGPRMPAWGSAAAGLVMGLAFTLPQVVPTRMPAGVAVLLVAYLTLLWIVFAVGGRFFLKPGTLAGALAAGGLLPILDWANFTLVPVWGTAQSFVRPWSTSPGIAAFVCFTGITGISLLLGCVQALLVTAVLQPEGRTRTLPTLFGFLALLCAGDLIPLLERPEGSLRAAAVGWTREDLAHHGGVASPEGFARLFREPVTRAADRGARLVVTPELAFSAERDPASEDWFLWASSIARENEITLVMGYFHEGDRVNRLLFIGPDGSPSGAYTKVFLTPYESYGRGDGSLIIREVRGVRTGAMICQDDNFTSLSRRYGRAGVSVVAVPTYDWPAVKDAHFQNSRFRPMESGYGIVRAARDGISAIVSARGEIVELKDHVEEGAGYVVGDLPLYPPGSLYNRLGHWPALAGLLLVLFGTAAGLKKKPPITTETAEDLARPWPQPNGPPARSAGPVRSF